MAKLDALMEGYLAYKRDVNCSAVGTVRDIRCTLNRVVNAMEKLKPDKSLWHCTLEDYLLWIEQERQGLSTPASLNKFVTHVRGFLEYALRSGRAERNVLDGFQLHYDFVPSAPKCITQKQAQQLIKNCPKTTSLERRDRVIILLFYGCGLRTHELCALNIQHVQIERQELNVLTAKGDRPRVVPIPAGVFTELIAYLYERGGKLGPLFRTVHKRKRINNKDASLLVQTAAKAARLEERVTPKTLRHSYATHLMDRGVDLGIIASLMGHRSPKETGVYLHVLPGKKESAVTTIQRGEGI